jgi:BASS family bile acid:Na+ symporter
MQSVGQTGRHFSQPVQSAAITACNWPCAPTMASVGQTFRHSAQPMQLASSTIATGGKAMCGIMPATMSQALLQDALVITLNVAAMLAMGLELTLARLRAAVRRPGPMALGLGVNLVAAPLLGWLLIVGLDLPEALALGFMLVAAAPGGNVGPLFTANARGDIAYSVALVVILSFASVVSVPLLMGAFAGDSRDFGQHAPAMVRMILTYQIAPLLVGMLGHAIHARLALRIAPVARLVGTASLLALTVALIVTKGGVILEAGWLPLLAIEAFVLVMIASGLLLGSPRSPEARALGLTSCTRNLACSMLLGSQVFAHEPAVMMGVLAYGLLWLPTAMPLSFWLRRFA